MNWKACLIFFPVMGEPLYSEKFNETDFSPANKE